MILFSYGFRPFFLGAAAFAFAAMILWLAALFHGLPTGGDYGSRAWHGHEMLFGFASAVLAGFLLTAVPNWTGRLPVSGPPLLYLFLLWCVGRVVMVAIPLVGAVPAAVLDSLFLPALLTICLREIIAGRKWKDLKVAAGLGALTLANLCFHVETLRTGGADTSTRLALAAYTTLIIIVGGRILPSFTRNWLAKTGRTDFPTAYNRFDVIVILASVPALASWVLAPASMATAGLGLLAAFLQAGRLYRWRGWTTMGEPILAVLHLAYAFVILGFFAIAATAVNLMEAISALHLMAIGTVSTMMLAVMTRATRGHTGRELNASRLTCLGYLALFACAIVRPLAGWLPDHAPMIYELAGLLWLLTNIAYLIEYGPMLATRRRSPL
ncbi:NnrS family protein [Rhizobium oryzicola]|uniref:NnrS family protein n=1 Tax=Rhizobium oryzicola TaxID=1232668 RepID=A0ABT8SX11_9HYPH|nr:NnrS family protein [Rhizobium oryzicola]MDO1582886.1 NnrS family protein [Rhizobium oryzicola]